MLQAAVVEVVEVVVVVLVDVPSRNEMGVIGGKLALVMWDVLLSEHDDDDSL